MSPHRRILFFLIALLIHDFVTAQTERQKQMVSFTYSIIKNIKWSDKETPFIKTHVITTDDTLKEQFRRTSKNQKLAGRNAMVSFTDYVVIPKEVDVIFVANQYNTAIPALLDKIDSQGILLITDRYDKQRDVMINFLNIESGKLNFEFNQININNQGLKISPKIKELGGSEVNLAKIVKQLRDSIKTIEVNVNALDTQFDLLNLEMVLARRLFRGQDQIIRDMDQDIMQKEKNIIKQNKILDNLTIEFAQSEGRLIDLTKTLNVREKNLTILTTQIVEQRENVAKGNKILDEQRKRIAEQDNEIVQRENRLEEMSTIVDSQQNALVFLILFLAAVVIFSFLIFTAYRMRIKAAKKLAKQKEKLGRLLKELKETQSQVIQSEKMVSLGVLTAGIAHEINNATNFVYSGIHILRNNFAYIKPTIIKITELKKEHEAASYNDTLSVIDEMIKIIQVGAERTTEIVKGLKIFSRLETEKMTKIDVHNDIDVALLLLSNRYKGIIEIEKEFTDPKILETNGFKGQLSQAFLNIIINSIDSVSGSSKEGKIKIKTSKNKNGIEVKITDNGIGMSKEESMKIFDPFYTTKNVGTGTGLGLSITYGIIERHGGIITVDTKPDEGAEFIIKLPLIKLNAKGEQNQIITDSILKIK